jgi:tRNA pseudouridine38-40 synthase
MVRIISGTLIQVGSGEIQPGEMKQILEARDRSAAGPTAIPKGLVLKKIEYPEAEE